MTDSVSRGDRNAPAPADYRRTSHHAAHPCDRLLTETVTADPAWSAVLLLDVSRSAAALARPASLAAAVDAQTTGGDLGTVGRLAGLVAVLILLDLASLLVSPWHVNTLVLGLRRDLRGHVLRLGLRDRAAFSTGP